MPRTTSPEVEAILRPGSQGGDYDDDNEPSLEPYIATASALVDRVATCATNKGITLSATELELIERWLAAHCYCLSDQTYASKSTEGASASFHGQTGMAIESTRYGQMALTLDVSGCLMALSKRQVASAGWLGKSDPDKLTYDQRN